MVNSLLIAAQPNGTHGSAARSPHDLHTYQPALDWQVTKAEYWATYYEHPDASYEWNGGILEAKPMATILQYQLYLWFATLLKAYSEVYAGEGLLMGSETGFTMTVPDLKLPGQFKETVRKPDIAYVRHDNPVGWGQHERSYRGICDLCIEVLSDSQPSEIERDTKTKKAEYEFAGVQEYYILDEEDRYTKFYQRTATGNYVEIQANAEGVIRSAVLPGFQFRKRDLRDKPALETLATDAVYQGYVLLKYQGALAREKALATELQQALAELARLRAGKSESA